MITITQTNGNGRNMIRGCRVTIRRDGEIVDQFVVPVMWHGVDYCKAHPRGRYGQRFYDALEAAVQEFNA